MNRAHKIKLKPNKAQLTALKKAAGCARFAYNWTLDEWNKQYELFKAGKAEKPDVYSMSRKWTANKPEWAYESPKDASLHGVLNVGQSFRNFWNGMGKPKFKRKGAHDCFYIQNDRVKPHGRRITLSKIGSVKMTEALRFEGKIMGAVVSCDAGDWFISIAMEMPDKPESTNTSVVGVDVGITAIAVASDGTRLVNPKPLTKYDAKIRRLQRRVARKVKRSSNRWKAIVKLQKVHRRVRRIRSDAIHKFTSALAKNHGLAVVETLNTAVMKVESSKWIRRSLQDTAMVEVHRQLEYKMPVRFAPPFYPSSKTCSACGLVKDTLPLEVRIFDCAGCGHHADRDDNASCNLRNMRWVTPFKPAEPARAGDETGNKS